MEIQKSLVNINTIQLNTKSGIIIELPMTSNKEKDREIRDAIKEVLRIAYPNECQRILSIYGTIIIRTEEVTEI